MTVDEFIATYPPTPGCPAPLWFRQFPSVEDGWANCKEVDWLLWIIAQVTPGSIKFARMRTAMQALAVLAEQTTDDTALMAAADAEGVDEAQSFAAMFTHAHRAFDAYRRAMATPDGKAALAEFVRTRFNPLAS